MPINKEMDEEKYRSFPAGAKFQKKIKRGGEVFSPLNCSGKFRAPHKEKENKKNIKKFLPFSHFQRSAQWSKPRF